MELNFDVRGFLKPYQRIRITSTVFKETFVDGFEEDSTRHVLYKGYQSFTKEFSKSVTINFAQWIGGSFVTTKRNPNDLDLVTIINIEDFLKHEKVINEKFRMKTAKLAYGVDSYMLPKYNKESPKYAIFHGDSLYWNSFFTKTKKNRAKKSFPKGYIEILFNDYKP